MKPNILKQAAILLILAVVTAGCNRDAVINEDGDEGQIKESIDVNGFEEDIIPPLVHDENPFYYSGSEKIFLNTIKNKIN